MYINEMYHDCAKSFTLIVSLSSITVIKSHTGTAKKGIAAGGEKP